MEQDALTSQRIYADICLIAFNTTNSIVIDLPIIILSFRGMASMTDHLALSTIDEVLASANTLVSITALL
jgi:hypothetical protein